MNKTNIPEPEPDDFLKRTLRDDLPPEEQARMNRQFLRLKTTIDRTERPPEPDGWMWMRAPFRKEILAAASAAMIILGLVMQMSGSQDILANSIEQLKVILTVSVSLNRASSMDCTVLKPGAGGEQISYRVRWHANGDVRVDMDSTDGAQTLWISNETVSVAGPGGGDVRSMPNGTMTPGPVWQPGLEFMSPKILAKNMEGHYGLMQNSGRFGAGQNEFLIAGREGNRMSKSPSTQKHTFLKYSGSIRTVRAGRTEGGIALWRRSSFGISLFPRNCSARGLGRQIDRPVADAVQP